MNYMRGNNVDNTILRIENIEKYYGSKGCLTKAINNITEYHLISKFPILNITGSKINHLP